MLPRDKEILTKFAESIRVRFKDARIWAYGSRVRETQLSDSDLDVCVVLDRFSDRIDSMIMEIAWQIGFENDILISTVVFSARSSRMDL